MAIQAALGVWDSQIPALDTALIFEMYQSSDGGYYVRSLYKNDSISDASIEPRVLVLPGNVLDNKPLYTL